jgi:fimbrial chaperone protein
MSKSIATRRIARAILPIVSAISAACPVPAFAAALRVEPVLVEVFAPGAAAALTLHNGDASEVNVQIRVFRWSQANGKETLEPTADVAISPPAAKLAPHGEQVVRIVRVGKQPLQTEESYRIFVDQLPRYEGKSRGTVNLLVRQSIPAFFSPSPGREPSLAWSLVHDGGKLVLSARNAGPRRARISSLTLTAAGKSVSFGNGLVGYALADSTMSWVVPGHKRSFDAGGPVMVEAQSDQGPIHAAVPAPARR